VSLRIAVAGAGGRMGQALVEAVLAAPDLTLAAALDVRGSASIGQDAGERIGHRTGVAVTDDVDGALAAADVLIDFTRPEGTVAHAAACARRRVALVAGTTGLSPAQKAELATHARTVPIVFAPNMSVGVNVLLKLVELATARLGPDYDVEIVEMHHRHKVDAPSGTALRLGEAAASAMRTTLSESAVYAREGVTGERRAGTIGFALTFALGQEAARQGSDLPVILISHNMPHVFEIADRIHVARLGRRAAILNPKKISMSDTVAVMTGAMPPEQIPAECLAH